MSKLRSPREVCSITIGINGLIRVSLASGGPQFRNVFALFLLGRPDRLARFRLRHRDALHIGRDAVERELEAYVLAPLLLRPVQPEVLDQLVGVLARGLRLLPDRSLHVVVRDRQVELVRHGLEDDLAGDGEHRLADDALLQLLRRRAGRLEVDVERDAAPLQRAREAVEQLAGATLHERAARLDLRRLDELVDDARAEAFVGPRLEVLLEALLDVGAQLREGVELARALRQVVVEGRQLLRLDLLDGHRDGALGAGVTLEDDL